MPGSNRSTPLRRGLLALLLATVTGLAALSSPALAGEFTLAKTRVAYLKPAMAPDGKALAAVTADGLGLTLHDLATGAVLKTIRATERIQAFALNPSGSNEVKRFIALGGRGYLRLYDYPACTLAREFRFPVERGEGYGGTVHALAFAENANTLAYSYGERTHGGLLLGRDDHTQSKLVFLNLDDGKVIREIPDVPVTDRLVWSSNGAFVAGIFNPYYVMQLPGQRAQVRVFKPSNGHEVVNPKEVYGVSFVDFAPFDTHLVTASPRAGIVEIYSMLLQRRVHSVKFRWGALFAKPCFATSHNGIYLAMGGTWRDSKEGTPILIYNLQSGTLVGKLHEAGNVTSLAFGPDDQELLACEEQGATVIDFEKFALQSNAEVVALGARLAAARTTENLREHAMACLDKGFPVAARRDLDAILAQDPQDGDAYNKRALANDNLTNYDDAIADYTRAMELSGKTPALYSLRSMVYFASNDRDKALDDIDHAILYDPANITYVLLRGMYYHDLKWADLTISSMKAVVAKQPGSAEAWYLLADGYYLKDDLDTALKHYDKAIALDPEHAASYRMRAEIHGRKNNVEKCFADANRYIAIAERHGEVSPDVYLRRGAAWQRKGKLDEALRDYATADQYGDPRGYLNLITSQLSDGHAVTRERLNALHEIVALAPDNKEALEWLARAELMKKDAESWARPMDGSEWGGYDSVYAGGYAGSPGTYSSPAAGPAASYGYHSGSSGYSGSTAASRQADYNDRQAAQRRTAQDRANYQQINQKFWNMNNPFNKRR